MHAVILISHGSHSRQTKVEVQQLVDKLKKKSAYDIFAYAFLEIESPSIPESIDHCIQKGAGTVTILMNFLNSGKHVDEDIPRIVGEARKKYPKVTFRMTRPVGQHEKIVELFTDILAQGNQKIIQSSSK